MTVVYEIKSKNKEDAIKEIISRAAVFDCICDKEKFVEAVFDRENEGSCVGHGVAFSHGKIQEVSEMKIALGLSREGIKCDAPDGGPVHLLFVVATNPAMYRDYLQRISILAKIARMESFRSEILSCFGQKEAEEKLKTAYTLYCTKQAV